jgi:trk system potassium uptake protein
MKKHKIAVLGLGHFGLHLSLYLTDLGAEVLAIDRREERVELLRDKVSHAVVLDTTDPRALAQIGIRDFDAVVVAIGEGFESSILTTAHLQELKVKRIINRVVSPVHERILRLMNVPELILPEGEAAAHLARRLTIKGVIESVELSGEYSIIEARLPRWARGKTLNELDLRRRFNINLVTVIQDIEKGSDLLNLGKRQERKVLGVPDAEMKFEADDILVLFGKETSIRQFLEQA